MKTATTAAARLVAARSYVASLSPVERQKALDLVSATSLDGRDDILCALCMASLRHVPRSRWNDAPTSLAYKLAYRLLTKLAGSDNVAICAMPRERQEAGLRCMERLLREANEATVAA